MDGRILVDEIIIILAVGEKVPENALIGPDGKRQPVLFCEYLIVGTIRGDDR